MSDNRQDNVANWNKFCQNSLTVGVQ